MQPVRYYIIIKQLSNGFDMCVVKIMKDLISPYFSVLDEPSNFSNSSEYISAQQY